MGSTGHLLDVYHVFSYSKRRSKVTDRVIGCSHAYGTCPVGGGGHIFGLFCPNLCLNPTSARISPEFARFLPEFLPNFCLKYSKSAPSPHTPMRLFHIYSRSGRMISVPMTILNRFFKVMLQRVFALVYILWHMHRRTPPPPPP